MQITDDAYEMIDELIEIGKINESTYQCAADIVMMCDSDEQGVECAHEVLKRLHSMSLSELKEWRKQDIVDYKDSLTIEDFNKRFEIGSLYSSEQHVLDSTNWDFFTTRLLPELALMLTPSEEEFLKALDDCYLDPILANASDYRTCIEKHIGKVAELYCQDNEVALDGNEPYWLVQLFDQNNVQYLDRLVNLKVLKSDILIPCMEAIRIPIFEDGYQVRACNENEVQGVFFVQPFGGISLTVRLEQKCIELMSALYTKANLELVQSFCNEVNKSDYIVKAFYTDSQDRPDEQKIVFSYNLLAESQGAVGMHALSKAVMEFVSSIAACCEAAEWITLNGR